MKEFIVLIIKGFFIGLANIIPGVSGGTLALTLGIYDKLISTISHFFSNLKKNLLFIIPIGIGAALSILSLSHVISFCLDRFILPTVVFFIGTILGGMPMLLKKVNLDKINYKDVIVFLITFSLIVGLTFLTSGNVVSLDVLSFKKMAVLFGVGVIVAATMIIPGISGSAVLMTLGYYEPVINVVKDITNFGHFNHNLLIIVPLVIGFGVGILLMVKIIEFLLKKYEERSYYGIMGFVLASVVSIIIQNFIMNPDFSTSILQVLASIVLFIIGFILAIKLGDK